MGFMWDPKISLSLYKVGINLFGRFVGGGWGGAGAVHLTAAWVVRHALTVMQAMAFQPHQSNNNKV